uniref:Uncharacterized protein n=1 Tax=Eutreptiella gymnastica TaxID=73025 RepID=A0A7S1NNZ9_9EUGL
MGDGRWANQQLGPQSEAGEGVRPTPPLELGASPRMRLPQHTEMQLCKSIADERTAQLQGREGILSRTSRDRASIPHNFPRRIICGALLFFLREWEGAAISAGGNCLDLFTRSSSSRYVAHPPLPPHSSSAFSTWKPLKTMTSTMLPLHLPLCCGLQGPHDDDVHLFVQ